MGTTKEKKASVTKGWIFMSLWAILILSGIVAKRGFSHPDLVVFFHVPAAVFLVLAWRELSYEVRKRYRAVIDGEKGTHHFSQPARIKARKSGAI